MKTEFNFATVAKYAGAFAAGFVGPLIPLLLQGTWPNSEHYAMALGSALTTTFGYHLLPPRADGSGSKS